MTGKITSFFNKAAFGIATLASLNIAVADSGAQENQALNLQILLQAQSQYQQLIREAGDSNSAELQKLATSLNDYRVRNKLDHYTKITFFDPIQADVGLALGLPRDMVIQTMLLQEKILPVPPLRDLLNRALYSKTTLSTNGESYTQSPVSLFLVFGDAIKSACMIVPTPANTIPDVLKVPAMSPAKAREFQNRHEGWHCLDNVYHSKFLPSAATQSIDPANLGKMIGNAPALDAYSTMHKAEIFADVAALGEMIRNGDDLVLIDTISEWRAEKAEDLKHLSSPVLRAFKKTITDMGVQAFRSMSEEGARKLYYATTESYALNAARLEIKLKYDQADDQQKKMMATDENAAKAIAFQGNFAAQANTGDISAMFTQILGGPGLSADAIARKDMLTKSLAAWKPMDDLIDSAWKAEGRITPASLAHAYTRTMSDYNAKAGTSDVDAEKADRLKADFTQKLTDLDFATLNERRGVAAKSLLAT